MKTKSEAQRLPENVTIIITPYGAAILAAELVATISEGLGCGGGGINFFLKAKLVDEPHSVNGYVDQVYYDNNKKRIVFYPPINRKEKVSDLLSWCRKNIRKLATQQLLDGAIIMNHRNSIANLQAALSDVTKAYNKQIRFNEEEIRGLLARSFPDRV